MSELAAISGPNQNVCKLDERQGWLYKWTNYVKGYQKRWFVLKHGQLLYYRNPKEIEHTCRGTISLAGVTIQTTGHVSFIIANGSAHSFHLRADSEVDMQSWITALEIAKANAVDSDDESGQLTTIKEAMDEMNLILTCLKDQYRNVKGDSDTLRSHFKTILKLLEELETNSELSKKVQEVATLARIVSYKFLDSCSSYMSETENHFDKWRTYLQNEYQQKKKFEDMVEQLAKQLDSCEQEVHEHAELKVSKSEDDNEFYDCVNDYQNSTCYEDINDEPPNEGNVGVVQKRRTHIPEKPNMSLNVWSFLKTCIGKDLTRIPVPVNFSEPLSMLQRLAEDFEYAYLLDKASQCNDPYEQVAFLAAFIISGYSTTSDRTTKPFNPILGETYECDRSCDLGWKLISEQVSHHPPISAEYCEGKSWRFWQEFSIISKFRGKYIQVTPLGRSVVEFTESGNCYSWSKVTTTVHNIIVGRLWMDHSGEMVIEGHQKSAGISCHLKFIPYSYFYPNQQKRVKGHVSDVDGNFKWIVEGIWDSKVDIGKVIKPNSNANSGDFEVGVMKTVWRRKPLASDAEKNYNFTVLTAQLNEMEPGIAPTDSRNRPDQRLMEAGKWDEANAEKLRLEEKQRAVRRNREEQKKAAVVTGQDYDSYRPSWFQKQLDSVTGLSLYLYTHEYWECKEQKQWSRCPNIF